MKNFLWNSPVVGLVQDPLAWQEGFSSGCAPCFYSLASGAHEAVLLVLVWLA